MPPTESVEYTFQIRDILLGLSLLISSASLLLHWYRGRKLVVIENEESGSRLVAMRYQEHSTIKEGHQSEIFVKIQINNETRHSIRVVGQGWHVPIKGRKKFNLGTGSVTPKAVKPQTTEILDFSLITGRYDIYRRPLDEMKTSPTVASSSPIRSSNEMIFSLNIQSKAFWWRTKQITKRVTVNESVITAMMSNKIK